MLSNFIIYFYFIVYFKVDHKPNREEVEIGEVKMYLPEKF